MKHALLMAAVFASMILLSSCQTPPSSTSSDPSTGSLREPSVRSVIGQLELYEEGSPIRMGLFADVSAAAFVAAPSGSEEGRFLDVDTDGKVDWKLAAGEYELVALRLVHRSGRSVVRLNGHLSVLADRAITRIGIIRAERGSFGSRVRLIGPSEADTSESHVQSEALPRPLTLLAGVGECQVSRRTGRSPRKPPPAPMGRECEFAAFVCSRSAAIVTRSPVTLKCPLG